LYLKRLEKLTLFAFGAEGSPCAPWPYDLESLFLDIGDILARLAIANIFCLLN
jgi:hypothetical protein